MTTPTPTPLAPQISIQKTVRNVTQNGAEAKNTNANPSETVEFVLRISSGGTATATQVVTRDTLPSGLAYQGGTTTIDGAPASDGIVGTGVNLGDMAPGRIIIVRFRATVAPETFFSFGTSTLANIGFAQGSNTPQVSDTAFVTVMRAGSNPSLGLTKLGLNISRGETTESTVVYAAPGQTLAFMLHVRNTSSTPLTGLVVRDALPQGVAFIPGTVKINGTPFAGGDTLITSGIYPGSLAPGQEIVIQFSGIVSSSQFPAGLTTLINTAYAAADNVPQLIAQLPIIIGVSGIVVPPVQTGPGESALMALIVSAIITLLYVGYTSTDTFLKREAEGIAQESKRDRSLFDFRR